MRRALPVLLHGAVAKQHSDVLDDFPQVAKRPGPMDTVCVGRGVLLYLPCIIDPGNQFGPAQDVINAVLVIWRTRADHLAGVKADLLVEDVHLPDGDRFACRPFHLEPRPGTGLSRVPEGALRVRAYDVVDNPIVAVGIHRGSAMGKHGNPVGGVNDKVAEHARPAGQEVTEKFGGHDVRVILTECLNAFGLEAAFKGQARFRNAIFYAIAGFDGCTFDGVVTFKNATLCDDGKFRTAVFNGYCLFGNALFKTSARFANTHFVKGVNFAGTKFSAQADFGGVYSSSRAVPVYEAVFFARRRYGDDESFWRFVKQSAQEAGYYQLAGECFYNERSARLWQKFRGTGYDALSGLGKLMRLTSAVRLLPELIFGKLLFGYGERPVRVLVASALIIFICAIVYSQPGWLVYNRPGPYEPSFLQGLYFSVITFTTLGYGDFYPAAESFCRQLAMVEAISGGFLMALFVVCLAKRFSRG